VWEPYRHRDRHCYRARDRHHDRSGVWNPLNLEAVRRSAD
jgi:hypothetical protein